MKFAYTTAQQRTDILAIQAAAGMRLIEEQNLFDGNYLVFTDPPPVPATLEEARAAKLAALAATRWQRETGGITVNGIAVATDRESQALLTGAWCRCQQDPETLINWKGGNGWVQLGKTAVEYLAVSVSTHIEDCFTNERIHAEAIAELTTIEEVSAYDITTGWPSNQ